MSQIALNNHIKELSDTQVEEWVRQNFFDELDEQDFASEENISKARELYKKVKIFFVENEIPLIPEALNYFEQAILGDEVPTEEDVAPWRDGGADSPTPDSNPTAPKRPAVVLTPEQQLAQIHESTQSTEKMIFWGLLLLAFIIIFK